MTTTFRLLTGHDRAQLRRERVRSLEADLCRAQLALEDALSDTERVALACDIDALTRRLQPHYVALGLLDEPDKPPPTGDHA